MDDENPDYIIGFGTIKNSKILDYYKDYLNSGNVGYGIRPTERKKRLQNGDIVKHAGKVCKIKVFMLLYVTILKVENIMNFYEKCTLYEKRMKNAQDNDRVIFYDYLSYKRAAGWWTGLINDDWNRPYKIKRAKYNAAFLQNLPDYYFLGFSIKDLLKTCYSVGYCHACAIALSLCFDDFEIITCNLANYVDHYNQKSDRKIDEFEHTFIVVDLEEKRTVIDTSDGMITDYDTYKHIFSIDKIRSISFKDLKGTEIYQYIEKRKYDAGPSYESELYGDESYKKYSSMLHEYMDMCKNYSNPNNRHLQDFINRCLYRTSNSACLDDLRMSQHFKSIVDYQIEYPTINLFSLTDDEFDTTLESPHKDTKERNARVLENYHREIKPQKVSFKRKILELVRKI